jgi:hypothetical protein
MSWSLRYLPLAVEPRERLRTPQFLLSLQCPSTGFPWSPTPPPSAQRWYPPIIQNDPTERGPRSKTLLYPDGFLTSTLPVFRDGFARTIATRKKGDCRAAGERSSLAGTERSNPSPSRESLRTSGPRGPTTSRPITLRLLPGRPTGLSPLCRRGRRALPAVKQVWVSLAAQADKEGWPARFLAALAEHEIAERSRRRLERHLAEARLPPMMNRSAPPDDRGTEERKKRS